MNCSYLFLAPGFEEIEALTPVDVLRRSGMTVKTVSITNSREVVGAHGVTVKADALFGELSYDDAQWLILPGGMPGASNLAEFQPLNSLLTAHARRGGDIAAICAAPAVVLAPLGILDNRPATCYPGFDAQLGAADYTHGCIAIADNGKHHIVTANGPATALAFALTIVELTLGRDASVQTGAAMLLYPQAEEFNFG